MGSPVDAAIVNLRRGHGAMPQNPLNEQDIDTGLEQSGRESAPQIVRTQLSNTGDLCPLGDDASDRLGRKASTLKSSRAVDRNEQCSGQGATNLDPAI